jgi:hypothetical protein
MVNYSEGKVYKIVSNQTEKIYVGSTTKHYLSARFCDHRGSYKRWKLGHKKYCTSFEILKFDDARIVLLENVNAKNKEELLSRELYYYEQNKNICVNQLTPIISPEEKEQKQRAHMQTQEYKERKREYDKKRKEQKLSKTL